MTKLLHDIRREPAELSGILTYTAGPGRAALESAARIAGAAEHLYITGIGSSWHAGMAVAFLFETAGRPCHLIDASELLHFTRIPAHSAIIVLSRSGRSFEIVGLLAKVKEAGAKVIAVTNTPASPLTEAADVVLLLAARFDHLVSITMYSGLVAVGGLLASAAADSPDAELCRDLHAALAAVETTFESWCDRIGASNWLAPGGAPTYFLGRGGSLASCHEARLLWEEAAKVPASAMTTGGFRHGPQEMVKAGLRLGLWIGGGPMRDPDLTLADDLRACGAQVLVIGQNVPRNAGDLVISLPPVPDLWQPLIDVIPAQIAAESLARVNGEDCDAFRFCPYIVETAGGLGAR